VVEVYLGGMALVLERLESGYGKLKVLFGVSLRVEKSDGAFGS